MAFRIREDNNIKIFNSPEFNYVFNKDTGYHMQWGRTQEEDAKSPYGPVIADIEVLSMCKGPGGRLCPFCYKSNTPNGHYMSLEDYKVIFSKLPKTLTQIAFGADADCSLNPDLFDIMRYTRDNGVIPNITVADISWETARILGEVAGAVAVSWYGMHTSKNYCYDSIWRLSINRKSDMNKESTLAQINMHFMLSKETLPFIDELIQDIKTDPRLKYLNAVVFLSLKQKGRGAKFQGCTDEEFKSVVDRMFEAGVGFGFDSCSAPRFIKSIKGHPKEEEYIQMSEPCESFSQSLYVNERGIVVPCSFMENMEWNENDSTGWNLLDVSVKDADEFVTKVWNSDRALLFSERAVKCASCGNGCQVYNV